MVGQCDGRSPIFGGPSAKTIHTAGPIEQGVFRVNVEMNELRQLCQALKKTKLQDVTLLDG